MLVCPDPFVLSLLEGMEGSSLVGFLVFKASSDVVLASVGKSFSILRSTDMGVKRYKVARWVISIIHSVCERVKLAYHFLYYFLN